MSKETFTVAMVGCGQWGQNLVRNFAALNALACVCDPDPQRAQTLAEEYHVPACTFDEILESAIPGVAIAAPASQHFALAERALQAGKHVFVEKPLALKVPEAQALCELAQRQLCILMVGHLMQYHPAFLRLREIVERGDLGKLQYIYSNRLNLGRFRREENILWSFAPHDISMILSLAGQLPTQIHAHGSTHINPPVMDVTHTHLSFQNGMEAHVFVSWLHPFKEQKLVVVGDRGMMVLDDGLDWSEKLKLYPHEITWNHGLPCARKAPFTAIDVTPDEPLQLECQHFIDCMASGRQPRTHGQEGLAVLQVLDAAQRAVQQQAPTTIQTTPTLYWADDSASIDDGCTIGLGTKIWHFTHILGNCHIGEHCVIGQNVMIGPQVTIGDRCKIQNNVSVYKGVTLERGVFCGPSCVFTNVINPRAEVERKDEFRETHVEEGVTIGANATILCGLRLGAYSLIGAGAVITKDVKPHAVMAGNPAMQIGWVSHAGEKLGDDLVCPREGRRYQLQAGRLVALDAAAELKEAVSQ